MNEHGEAIDYDLLSRTGLTLRDWEQGRLDSRSLYRFVKQLGPDSAYFRASHPNDAETSAWLDGRAVCALLADLVDTVNAVGMLLAYKGTGKKPPEIERYPRPWDAGRRRTKNYGSSPIPIGEFEDWYYGGGTDD